jgi:hypothetical protein
VAGGLYRVDGKPKRKIIRLLREEMKGKVSLWDFLRDMLTMGRAFLWP